MAYRHVRRESGPKSFSASQRELGAQNPSHARPFHCTTYRGEPYAYCLIKQLLQNFGLQLPIPPIFRLSPNPPSDIPGSSVRLNPADDMKVFSRLRRPSVNIGRPSIQLPGLRSALARSVCTSPTSVPPKRGYGSEPEQSAEICASSWSCLPSTRARIVRGDGRSRCDRQRMTSASRSSPRAPAPAWNAAPSLAVVWKWCHRAVGGAGPRPPLRPGVRQGSTLSRGGRVTYAGNQRWDAVSLMCLPCS
jgi:hypothetical protein